jgi:hypothetical protein
MNSTQMIYSIPVSNRRGQITITIKPDDSSIAGIRLKQLCASVYTEGIRIYVQQGI